MNNKGQTLVEIIVAIGIIVFALVGAVAATTNSVKVSRVSGDQAEAARYAQGVIESLQRQKEEDPEGFFASSCPSFGPFGDNGEYKVEVTCSFDDPGLDQVSIKVKVSWPEGSGNLSTSLDTIMVKQGY